MRYVLQYIIHNLAFITGLSIFVIALIYLLARLSRKIYIRDNLIFCFVLCLLTLLTDYIFFRSIFIDGFKEFYETYKLWGVFVFSTVTIFIMAVFAGIFAALRAIPFFGKFFMWLLWIIMTLPFKLFYSVVGQYPTPQDIFNLFNVKFATTLDTLFATLDFRDIFRAVLPSLIVIIAINLFSRLSHIKKRLRVNADFKTRISLIMTGLLIAAGFYLSIGKRTDILRDSMSRSLVIFQQTAENLKYYYIEREYNSAPVTRKNPTDNIIFILDESIRGDYISINNPEVNTTPVLVKYLRDFPENIFNYGIMLSAATVSFPSRTAILTCIDSLPDSNLKTFINPTLFDIAKANGYKTILMNVQGDFPDLVLRASDMARINEIYLSSGDFDGEHNYNADMNAAKFIRDRLKNEKGLFIFLEKVGSHIPYENRYPGEKPEHKIFMPKLAKNDFFNLFDRKPEEVINSYKNAIRYNLDNFFAALFGENPLELQDCTIIYTSDHGQSLMEYGQKETHGTGYFEQAIVPFLIFSTDSFVLENLLSPDKISGSLTHMNVSPTISSIILRDSEKYNNSLISRKRWANPPLIYLKSGTLWDGLISAPVSADSNGKIILKPDKYKY